MGGSLNYRVPKRAFEGLWPVLGGLGLLANEDLRDVRGPLVSIALKIETATASSTTLWSLHWGFRRLPFGWCFRWMRFASPSCRRTTLLRLQVGVGRCWKCGA